MLLSLFSELRDGIALKESKEKVPAALFPRGVPPGVLDAQQLLRGVGGGAALPLPDEEHQARGEDRVPHHPHRAPHSPARGGGPEGAGSRGQGVSI